VTAGALATAAPVLAALLLQKGGAVAGPMARAASPIIVGVALAYFAVVAGISVWAARRTRTAADFFVAGHGIGLVALTVASVSTSVSGFAFIGGPGLLYATGLGALYIILPAAVTNVLGAWVLAKRMRLLGEARGLLTVPDAVGARYNSPLAQGIAAVAILCGTVGYVATNCLAVGYVLDAIFGVGVPFIVRDSLTRMGYEVTESAQGAEGVFESTTIDGIPILATFSRSPGYGWTVVIGVPISRATAPLKVVAGFGALATLLLILTVWAALWTGRRLLGPVERLRAASEALGSGRPPDPAPTGLVEADQILASMHEAGHRISAANASLEARRQEAEAAAQALRTSNEMVQLATNASGLGLFTWFPESDAVIWHNDLPFEIFGLARDARPLNAKQFVTQFLLPDDAPEFERTLSRTLQEGLPFTFQGRIRRQPDGEVRWVQFMGQIEKAPHTNVRVVGTATDITQSKHTADALRDSEARLLQLANTIPNLAWMANADGWITWYNDRWYEYTGTTPQEMEGWGWQKVHDPATLPDVMVLWQKSISTGQPFEMTFPLLGKDGIFRPFFTSRNRGMGLGLAIVKGIIEAHHGAIVEAGEPGAGARFLIFLPLSPDSSGGGVTKQTEERKAT